MRNDEIQLRRPGGLGAPGYEQLPAGLAVGVGFGGGGAGAPGLPYDDAAAEPEQIESVFAKLHRMLRGRYKWCVTVSLVLLLAGAGTGFLLGNKIYVTTGIVQIKPYLPQLVEQIPETGLMPMYDNFVASQVVYITSPRVVSAALQSAEWKALGRPFTDEAMKEFLSTLQVRVVPRSEIVQVVFRDPDPRATAAAVKAVLTAYEGIHVKESGGFNAKDAALNRLQLDLSNQLDRARNELQTATNNYGIEGLRSLHGMKLHRLSVLEQTRHELEVLLAANGEPEQDKGAGAGGNGNATAVPAASAVLETPEMSVEEIALREPYMRNLIQDRDREKFNLDVTLRTLGDNHPKKQDARALLLAKEAAIETFAKHYREGAIGATAAGLNGATPQQLRQRMIKLDDLIKQANDDITASGRTIARADKIQRDVDQLVASLDQVNRRREQLDRELTPAQGRIQVSYPGDSASLDKDTRIRYSTAGGVFGLGLGVGLFLFLGMIDPRVRSLDDARLNVKSMTLLGVLPSLPEDLADPEQSALAAHCVHQIRTLLQISTGGAGGGVFAVTSPASGSGKTSLTLALGVSFAAASSRTLMIDCDIIGGGLTSRVDAIVRRKIGQVLRQRGLITQQQLETALRTASGSRKLLGQVLVELGFVGQADLDEALAAQRTMMIGMMDAIAGGDALQDCITETGIQGLSILPLGSAAPMDVSKLSPSAIRRLIEQVRHAYDVVLVDTGPVPGSLEASVAAASADGVILVLARGEHRALAERSIQHLRDIGARLAGMVFNRAEGRDMEFSTTANRTSSYERRSGIAPPVGAGADLEAMGAASAPPSPPRRQSPSFGPVATAVTGPRNTAGEQGSGEDR
jgi:Mrp family chromosome partitioning ATPase